MNDRNSNSFFDSRFIITMLLVFGLWVGWQSYLAKKYPEAFNKKNQTATKQTDAAPVVDNATENIHTGEVKNNVQDLAIVPAKREEKIIEFENRVWSFQLSSKGMAFKNVKLKNHTTRQGEPITFAAEAESTLFGTSFIGRREPIDFDITQTNDHEFVGSAVSDGMKITKVIQIKPDQNVVDTNVRVENIADSFVGLVTHFSDKIVEQSGGAFFMPSFEHQEFYIQYDGTSDRTIVDTKNQIVESFPKTNIAGFGSQYFALAIVDNSPILPEFKASTQIQATPQAVGTLSYTMLNKADSFALSYTAFIGPKSFEILKSINAELTGLINLGFFRSFAMGILWLMKTLYGFFGNWGVAIIFLTIIVRIVVMPLNIIGYRQMKAMSKLQPEMKLLREKYKNDQQKLNQEMMKLLKEAKANPLGGCLPMFIQIPVFFALYQVIGQSIELYQAPFILWINDLSVKDSFYVLPVLMGITMFMQQKITPTTMEPAQQKIMNFLPVLFTFLMVSLPSGLTLYIFVSTAFGVIQQVYFMKDKDNKTMVLAKSQ